MTHEREAQTVSGPFDRCCCSCHILLTDVTPQACEPEWALRTGKDLNGPKKQRKHLARIQAFTEAALNATALDGSPLLLALVRKLQVTPPLAALCPMARAISSSLQTAVVRQHAPTQAARCQGACRHSDGLCIRSDLEPILRPALMQ
jgi:hypothetical protein